MYDKREIRRILNDREKKLDQENSEDFPVVDTPSAERYLRRRFEDDEAEDEEDMDDVDADMDEDDNQGKKGKKRRKKKHRVFWFFVKLQMVLIVLVLLAIGYFFLGGYAKKVDALRESAHQVVKNSSISDFIPSQTVTLYDVNNQIISEKKGSMDADYVIFEDIPADYVTAIISIEDKKFYSHNGVDFMGLMRAVKAMIENGTTTQGGSTITMQLAKLIYMDSGRDWEYKVEQMFIAMELEKIYSKNKIMEFYLNNIYFSNGYYGIQSACHGYFDCELDELDISEIAFLLAIPNSPSYYDPVVNYDNTIERRDRILRNMYEDGKLSLEDYEAALAEHVELHRASNEAGEWNNYVDTYAYYCATRALMEAEGFEFKNQFASEEEEQLYNIDYDEAFASCQKELFTNGYSIYTSIDMNQQDALQRAIDQNLVGFIEVNEEGVYDMQASGVCIDNNTGMVTAIVGGRSQNFSMYTLNRAYQSFRQPGSAIKPLIVYTPFFERGNDPETIVVDQLLEDGPKNAGGYYWGEVTTQFAVAHSLNTVAWQLYEELTPEVGLQYLLDMNFSHIVADDYVLPTALGGFTKGVSALEMASAYATLAYDGVYREPSCILRIIDTEKNMVYEHENTELVIYGETAARKMTNVLETVFTEGTGRGLALENGMPVAGKTGTTNDKKDGWFVGYSRYYTTAIWVGCDMPKPVDELSGASFPGQIWQQYMAAIHENLAPIYFLPYAHLSDDFFEVPEESMDSPAGEDTGDGDSLEAEPDQEAEGQEAINPEGGDLEDGQANVEDDIEL